VLLEDSVIDRDRQRRETDRAGVPGQFQLPCAPVSGAALEAVLQIGNCEKSIAGGAARNGKACAPNTPIGAANAAAAPVRSKVRRSSSVLFFTSLDIFLSLSTGKALPSAQRIAAAARYRSTLTISEIGSISANFESASPN
jgi:hypothetical protein